MDMLCKEGQGFPPIGANVPKRRNKLRTQRVPVTFSPRKAPTYEEYNVGYPVALHGIMGLQYGRESDGDEAPSNFTHGRLVFTLAADAPELISFYPQILQK